MTVNYSHLYVLFPNTSNDNMFSSQIKCSDWLCLAVALFCISETFNIEKKYTTVVIIIKPKCGIKRRSSKSLNYIS